MLKFSGTTSMLKMSLLPLAAGFILTFQNCAPTEVQLSGDMNAGAQLSIAPDTNNQIAAIFSTVFGRLPSLAELAQYGAMLNSGASTSQIRSQLAQSSEAKSNIQNLLSQYLGSSAATSNAITSWQTLLGSSFSISQIESLIKKTP